METRALCDFMTKEPCSGEVWLGQVKLYTSTLFNPAYLHCRVTESLHDCFGGFRCMMSVHVTKTFVANLANASQSALQGQVFEVAPGQYAMILRVQVGNSQSVVVVPMGALGFASYLQSCESSGFAPVLAWNPDEGDELLLLLSLPDEFRNIPRLIELADASAENLKPPILSRLAALVCWFGKHERKSIIKGTRIEEMLISCVVPEAQGIR